MYLQRHRARQKAAPTRYLGANKGYASKKYILLDFTIKTIPCLIQQNVGLVRVKVKVKEDSLHMY
jgi:hypothetical protein